MIAYLRREVRPPARILGLGEELPPNRPDALRPGRRAELRLGRAVAEPRLVRAPVRARAGSPVAHRAGATIPWDGVVRAARPLASSRASRRSSARRPRRPGVFARVDRVGARLDRPPGSPTSAGDLGAISGRDRALTSATIAVKFDGAPRRSTPAGRPRSTAMPADRRPAPRDVPGRPVPARRGIGWSSATTRRRSGSRRPSRSRALAVLVRPRGSPADPLEKSPSEAWTARAVGLESNP